MTERPWVGAGSAGHGFRRLAGPSAQWGSNGLALVPDGALWIAEFLGGVVTRLDPATGERSTVLGPEEPLTAPDDLVVDDDGTAWIVDLPPGLVWRRDPDGTMTVVADGLTAPDGIARHRGRLFVNELAPDGRLLEIDLDGGSPRVMATGLALGNAMAVGPDGRLWYPHLMGGEVWRVDLDGGRPERVAAGLDRPVAVRFDPAGRPRVLANDATGTLRTLDPGRGAVRDEVATLTGADNVAFAADGTAFVTSAFRGGVLAVPPTGAARTLLPGGLLGPWGITVGDDGGLAAADHHGVALVGRDGDVEVRGHPGTTIPSGLVGIAARGGALQVTTVAGELHALPPDVVGGSRRRRVSGLADPVSVTEVADGLLVAERGTGRVLHVAADDRVSTVAEGLVAPVDVAPDPDEPAVVYATDAGRGQVLRCRDGVVEAVVAAGLADPAGLVAARGALWCVEAGTGRLHRIDPRARTRTVVAEGLPLASWPPHAAAPGTPAAPGLPPALGQRPRPFAALAATADGLVVAGTGEGSLLALGWPGPGSIVGR